jgi:hypothetical protein
MIREVSGRGKLLPIIFVALNIDCYAQYKVSELKYISLELPSHEESEYS